VFTGIPGTDGVTNFDTNGGLPSPNLRVALRVLYLQNTSNSAGTPFMAAKVRQH